MNSVGALVAHTLEQPHAAIAGGLFLATALWAVLGRAAVHALRWVVKKTPTKADDKVLDKATEVARWLGNHPEVVDVLHKGINAATGHDDGGK